MGVSATTFDSAPFVLQLYSRSALQHSRPQDCNQRSAAIALTLSRTPHLHLYLTPDLLVAPGPESKELIKNLPLFHKELMRLASNLPSPSTALVNDYPKIRR